MRYSLRDLGFGLHDWFRGGWADFEIFRGIFGFWFFGAVLGFILEVILAAGIIAFNLGRASIKRSSS